MKKRRERKDDLYITMYALVILLKNFVISLEEKDIGYNDAVHTLKETLARYKRDRIHISKAELEGLLYAANMLSEKELFWHPSKESFDKFVADLLATHKYNKDYCLLEDKNQPTNKVGYKKEEVEDV